MISRVSSLSFQGIDALNVDVQVQITAGIPRFIIVGLADKTIAESKERVEAALSSIGIALPAKKILINLSPADLIKEGSHFDLAIAASILTSIGVLPASVIENYMILGELSLDATILPVNGVLPAAIGANKNEKGLICSKQNGQEAAWSGNDDILAPNNLIELVNHFKGTQTLVPPEPNLRNKIQTYLDLQDIKGQKAAKRALEIAASGGHNMLMFGSPGSGKSMLAQRLPGIMPELTSKDILECSMISSVAGNIKNGKLVREMPFRSPHHSCSTAAMIGGGIGRKIRPGEISLAHNGVLFLDELPEFDSSAIEGLRQRIEDGEVLIARSGMHVKYPAKFQLIAAMNPCKCGYLSDSSKACSRAPRCGVTYQSKISGPILDRFDLHIEVGDDETYTYYESNNVKEESSEVVAKRVLEARHIQCLRYDGHDITTNSQLNGQLLTDYAMPVKAGLDILNDAAKKFKLSMRAYNKVLKVARTIADLEHSKFVSKIHIAEAISYRNMNFLTMVRT